MSNETSPFLTSDKLAPPTIGSWATSVLLTIEILQVVQYFRSEARLRDSTFIKLGVSVNLLADLVGTAACCATTYLYTITYWGNTEALEQQYWPLTVVVFTTGVVTAVSQLFMITRYWQMTKHHYAFALLFMILVGAVTGIFGCGVLMALSKTAPSMLLDSLLYLALIASAAGNALVALPLFWQLCKRNSALMTKRNFPFRITSMLFEAGALTTAVTVAGVATSLAARETKIWIAFAFIQARIYSCTMLYVLRKRPESETSVTGNAAETAHTMKQIPDEPVMVASKAAPVAIMEDADAFRLTRRKIELAGPEFDSDSESEVSRNLNNELLDMQDYGSRRPSLVSEGGHSEIPSRSESPSEYPLSASPDGRRSPWPLSPRVPSPISRSVSAM
ncbi:hypothetical protein B0H11DRAFT_2277125 [Mycena galericulata]|nr:hypothetical protein B0H11DRAFT_2277125 [Mycena galericulata]